ncbi:MAG TPA: TIGR04053 family radical SAM/SPASM domain-containing protein [Candidatus Limnocylindrales bacterium]|jgi:radical SAM protein|nr:TIGR04053 family radical SAM/SPASM domain-containing protein [Candidatus Limnocylindrales bacterium]
MSASIDPVPAPRPAGHPGGHPGGQPGGHPGGITGVGAVRAEGFVYDRAPMLVYWETTLACGLACRHCRATAQAERNPLELTTDEGYALLDEITRFGRPYPHVVFTGGDPLNRPDLEDLVRAATARGIGASLAPAATPLLTQPVMERLREAGIQNISLSLDGSDAARHDGFRMVPGTFDKTLQAARWARAAGLPIQVNTLVTDETLEDLPAVYELLKGMDIMRWSLFMLITTGRGAGLREVTPGQSEKLHAWLFELAKTAPFQVKTTEATHYRRLAIRSWLADGRTEDEILATSVGRGFGIRDGNGIVFINHDGTINPSGFLPIPLGNVRTHSIVDVYRDHPVMRDLRTPEAFKGRCGACEYNRVCGGSRARAYAWTGDPLEADPLCPYVPSGDVPAYGMPVAASA